MNCTGSGQAPKERGGTASLGIVHVKCPECRQWLDATAGPFETPRHEAPCPPCQSRDACRRAGRCLSPPKVNP